MDTTVVPSVINVDDVGRYPVDDLPEYSMPLEIFCQHLGPFLIWHLLRLRWCYLYRLGESSSTSWLPSSLSPGFFPSTTGKWGFKSFSLSLCAIGIFFLCLHNYSCILRHNSSVEKFLGIKISVKYGGKETLILSRWTDSAPLWLSYSAPINGSAQDRYFYSGARKGPSLFLAPSVCLCVSFLIALAAAASPFKEYKTGFGRKKDLCGRVNGLPAFVLLVSVAHTQRTSDRHRGEAKKEVFNQLRQWCISSIKSIVI